MNAKITAVGVSTVARISPVDFVAPVLMEWFSQMTNSPANHVSFAPLSIFFLVERQFDDSYCTNSKNPPI